MISENSITDISHLFVGDTEGFYGYKSGPQLVSFFNSYFGYSDVYRQGFPSRWAYAYDKIVDLIKKNRINAFLDIILGKPFLMRDLGITEVAAAEKSVAILERFNHSLNADQYVITQKGAHYYLTEKNTDLVLIGSGGFANVYRQKSTGLIIKKLKDDFLTDSGIRSRFKREFTITKSLQGLHGIIEVYAYNADECSYTMEPAEQTLEQYVRENDLSNAVKVNCIRQILHIMTQVHKQNVIHRDLSPNNVFIISGMLKLADFGLGKDLKVFTSHQTIHTNGVGQYYYCAPEQFMMLKNADKRSDVYSLGRVINFIMTKDPRDSHHIYRNVTEKATSTDIMCRFGDAAQLSVFFEKSVAYHAQTENVEKVKEKIRQEIYDTDVESYIYDMSGETLSKKLLTESLGFSNALIAFMKTNEQNAQHIIQCINQTFRDICRGSFEANDPFATFASTVLRENFSFVVKEVAANILRYIAWDVGRFSAQYMIKDIVNAGIDPLLEEIIDS